MFKKYLAGTALSLLALSTVCHASKMSVVNENKKPITIKIEAEGDSSAVTKMEVSAEHKSSFEVSATQLNGKSYFSIKGDTSAFTPGGKCEHLDISKNYKVTFQDDKMGTSCIADEMTS